MALLKFWPRDWQKENGEELRGPVILNQYLIECINIEEQIEVIQLTSESGSIYRFKYKRKDYEKDIDNAFASFLSGWGFEMLKMKDPTREEMLEALRGVAADYGEPIHDRQGDPQAFWVEEAIHYFAAGWHRGQSSNLYSALSTSKFKPRRGSEELSLEGRAMYDELVTAFCPGARERQKNNELRFAAKGYVAIKAFDAVDDDGTALGVTTGTQGRREVAMRAIGAIVELMWQEGQDTFVEDVEKMLNEGGNGPKLTSAAMDRVEKSSAAGGWDLREMLRVTGLKMTVEPNG